VVLATRESDTPQGAEALESLCRTYRYPVYAFVRRCGYSPDDAEDLTQGFFADMLKRRALGRADPAKGTFRSFLIICLKNYLRDERDKAKSAKRGGDLLFFSRDEDGAETRYQREPADERSPDNLFDRQWALTVLEQALNRLREEYISEGKSVLFEKLNAFLFPGETSCSYPQLAAELACTETAVRSVMHRMRRRYGELLRHIVADTVASREEVDAELRHLISVVSR
jgi:RNA polymerase sigma-70 factor (ECF subfamily)